MKNFLTGVIGAAALTALLLPATPATAGFNLNINIGGAVNPAPSAPPDRQGPPPWAPAHGRRAKHQYQYHPSAEVYFDPVRTSWFFLDAGSWVVRATLPDRLRISLGGAITLGMDVDRPYLHHKDVKGRHPGKGKMKAKSSKSKGNGKGKSKGKGRKK